ncbi:outer membrane protein assembly factor BamD [Robertkochia aurantiaca]|uniref:outer membrane protein assembly factor BamD n=1 Tax=Robertkochia aurantiaca TaxID=2873700 RepID=UPI001CCB407E|nr:outer membrane protein assembly factor BamD [Robertkochia sp. 3YJGBD-33]
MKFSNFFAILISALILTSCSEYQKVLKESDVKKKYEYAENLYNEGEYKKAIRLFEQIVPSYIGKPQGERIIYFYADAYYQTGQYYLSSYQFERFYKSYPRSEKAEEAAFLGAKSEYLTSPRYSLDQTATMSALNKLQVFINMYPESQYVDEANAMIEDLRSKIEKKAFEIAKQYNRISDYFASIKAFELFLKEYPGSVYREDALYYQFLASYNLAVNSVYSRREERLETAKENYLTLVENYPESEYRKEADALASDIEYQLENYSK